MKTILYVEESGSRDENRLWGSMTSLTGLLRGLDRARYRPKLVVYYWNDTLAELERGGVEVIRPGRSDAGGTDAPVERPAERSALGRWLRESALNRIRRSLLQFFGVTLPSARRFLRIIRAEKPDLVHCNNGLKINSGAVIAARLAGKKCVCHERGMFTFDRLDKWLCRFVDRFVCNSHAVKDSYVAQGLDPAVVEVIHNGIDLERFTPPKGDRGEPSEPTVVSVGRLIEWKGHQTLVRAARRVIESHPRARFVVVGSGPYEGELRALAGSLGLNDSVVFAGYQNDVRAALEGATVFAHCSIEPEPFGRTIIEAMAMRLPAIVSALGGPREIVTDGEDGIVVTPGDPDLLAAKIVTLFDDPALRARLGAAARKTVEARFDLRFNTALTQDVYGALLGG
jgi:glycosyltransferase involved in cell wall biosynthesis